MDSDTKAEYYPYIAFGIICLGTGLRLIGLDKGMWYDELYAVLIARAGDLVQALRVHDYPPTYFFLLRLWSSFDASEPFLRLLSVFLGVLTMVVTMAWVRSFSPFAAVLSGFLVATSPMLLRYSQEIQAYPLLLCAVACSFYCAHRISGDNPALLWYCCLATALCVAVTAHMVGIMILPSVCMYVLPAVWRRRHTLRWAPVILAVFIPVFVFGLTYVLFIVEGKAGGWWMPPLSVDLVITHFRAVLGIRSLQAPLAALGGYRADLALACRYGVVLSMALCFGCLMFLGDWRRSWMLLAAAGVFWFQIGMFSLVFLPIFWDRTILPGVIPLMAFAGVQATSIRRKTIGLVAVASLASLSLLSVTGWLVTEARVPYDELRQVGQYLESRYQPGNLVAFYHHGLEGPTRYYFRALRNDDAIPIALGTTTEAIDQELRRRVSLLEEKASPVVLFLVVRPDVLTRDSVTYANLLAYLESSATRAYPQRDFRMAVVFQYELPR